MPPKKLIVGFVAFIYLISLCSGVVPNSLYSDLWTNLKHKISELINELSGKVNNPSNSTLAVMGILLILPMGLVVRGSQEENPEIDKILQEFAEKCKEKFGEDLVSIVLFGSYARGTAEKYSDIDLLMVVKNLPERVLDREKVVSEEIHHMVMKYHIRVMPILVRPEDFQGMINPLIYGILTGYRVLYDPSGFWDDYLQRIKPRILEKRPVYIEYDRRWQIANLI